MGVGATIALIATAVAGTGYAIQQSTQQKKAAKTQQADASARAKNAQAELSRKRAALSRLQSGTKTTATTGGMLGEEIMKTKVGRLGEIR